MAPAALAFGIGLPASGQGSVDSTLLVNGLDAPVYLTAPPADERLFVLEQFKGRIRLVQGNQLLPVPFLDLPATTPFSTGFERGLLGMAFDPNYTANGHVFVSYTGDAGRTRIDRFTRAAGNLNQLDPSSQVVVLEVLQPFENHNGGCIAFGPDGYLYIGLGDGGGSGGPGCRSQDGMDLIGKLLRIDVSTIDTTGVYSIPSTNPYVGNPAFRGEIFLLGLRNPWRFSFDAVTGDLYVGDVGEGSWEEVDFLPAYQGGANLGWKVQEGNACYSSAGCSPATPPCGAPALTGPIWEYDHLTGCSITAGMVYRGSAIPNLTGRFLFADFCSNQVWSLDASSGPISSVVDHTGDIAPSGGLSIQFISSFGEDSHGEQYICDLYGGEVFRLVPQGAPGSEPMLRARFQRLSISQGGLQSLTLSAGPANAGNLYFVLGSASGDVPGFALDGLQIPLNLDGYLLFSLENPNQGPYARTLGLLKADGRADALVRVPPAALPFQLVGKSLHHAFLVVDPIFGTVKAASNPVPIEFLP